MYLFKIIILISVSVGLTCAYAQYDETGIGKQAKPMTSVNKSPNSPGVTSAEVSSGVNALAAITGDSRVASIGNIYVGYELYQKAVSKGWSGSGAFYMGLATLEFAQAGLNLKTSKTSKNSANYLSNDGLGQSSNGSGLDGGVNGDGGHSDFNVDDEFNALSNDPNVKAIYGKIPDAAKIINDIKKKGIKFNKETGDVTLPDGTKLSRADLAKEGQKVASSPKFKKMQARLARKRKAYLNRIARFRAAGGGGYKSAAIRKSKLKAKRPSLQFNFGKKGSRGIASVPGKVKMVNGDPLGVASDNVFNIVERAYQSLVTTKVLKEKIPKLGK